MGAACTRPALCLAVTQRVVGPDRAQPGRPASRFGGRAACFAAILIAFERGLAQDESAAERLLHLVHVSPGNCLREPPRGQDAPLPVEPHENEETDTTSKARRIYTTTAPRPTGEYGVGGGGSSR